MAYGAWGSGALMAFIGAFLPWVDMHMALRREPLAISVTTDVVGITTWILAAVACGAMLLLLIAKPPEAFPCLVAFGSTVAIVMIAIVNLQDIQALEPFSNPNYYDSQGRYTTGNGIRLVLAGGIVSCVGSFAFPLLGLWPDKCSLVRKFTPGRTDQRFTLAGNSRCAGNGRPNPLGIYALLGVTGRIPAAGRCSPSSGWQAASRAGLSCSRGRDSSLQAGRADPMPR